MKSDGRQAFWLAIGMPAIVLLGSLWIWSQDRIFRGTVVARLGASVEAAAIGVDPDAFGVLQARPEDASTGEYAKLRGRLASMAKVFKSEGVRGFYVMKVGMDETRFYVDSAPADDPWHSEPGVIYREPPAAVAEASTGGKLVFAGPYTDEYGRYYSSFVPIFDPSGRVAAVMGADIEVSAYDATLWGERLPAIGVTLFALAVCVTFFLLASKRRQEVALIRRYTKRLEILIDQMPVGILILEGRKGFATMSNEAAVRLLGKEIDSTAASGNFAATYGIVREDGSPYPESDLPLAETMANGRQAAKAGLFVKRGGVERPLAIRMASMPIRDEAERVAAVLVVLEDMAKEYEIDRQKSEFISIASHELRAPLTAIRWNTDLLLDKTEGALNRDQRAYASHIKEINGRLVKLVNELLDVSRLETGTVGVAPVKTDVSELLAQTVQDFAGLAGKKRQKLSYDRGNLPEIELDPRLIREVVTNLVSNAIKYTPEGGSIAVTAVAEASGIRVSVSDTGIGIPKIQQAQLFKKFFRASNASDLNVEGTGLGLYICKQAVELSGGTIGFLSDEGKGSTFWFTLPFTGSRPKAGTKKLS